jgi:peroxiredoxin
MIYVVICIKEFSMKKWLTIVCTFGMLSAWSQNQAPFSYKLTAKSDDSIVGKLFIEYTIADTKIKDSVEGKNGVFVINGLIPEPVMARIYNSSNNRRTIEVLLANTDVTLSYQGGKWAYINSNIQMLRDTLNKLTNTDRIKSGYYQLYGELKAKNDTVGLKKISLVFDSLNLQDMITNTKFLQQNQYSVLSLFAFSRVAGYDSYNLDSLEILWNKLPNWATEAPSAKLLRNKLNAKKEINVGTLAPIFSEQRLDGKTFSLESVKGKYVLLDFWSSWCTPCRKEHPNLNALYNKTSRSTFEIVAVSLDTDKRSWVAAVTKDKISWIQLSSLSGFVNPIAVKYGIQSVPSNFLIDPSGKIIAKNIKPDELEKKLLSLIPNPK